MPVSSIYWRPDSLDGDSIDFEPGTVLFERFRLERHLGTGGFGCVWEVHDKWLNKQVALKLSHHDLVKETLVLRNLPKDKFISIFDYAITPDKALSAYSMEMLAKPWMTLDKYYFEHVSKKRNNSGHVIPSVRTAVSIAVDILQNLIVLHGKKYAKNYSWCHGDIKPNNIYVHIGEMKKVQKIRWGAPTPAFIKIGDLGLACEKGALLEAGTYGFMAPEQDGSRCVGPNTDVYAVGQTLMFLLTGESLTSNDISHVSRLRAKLTRHVPSTFLVNKLAPILRKMTLKTPSQRLSAEASIEKLKQVVVTEEDWCILSKFAGELGGGGKLDDAADALYPDFSRLNGWKKKTTQRLDEIKELVRSAYKRNILRRQGHSYFLY
ncbi:hypothetical protein GEOBRER4_n2774 [Citrifermentans bremense]|uniref:Protein kinase domain-containing protein n=1 Tax=Citrifermentans bremense TaxID=60035 RepID=A0A6S6M2G1_9BACT|nr:protein kinase [Citrifermentans bremense]BCG47923.1 hypothetical protein GEOBRER4_n2774 [Citrifermentans bremense]